MTDIARTAEQIGAVLQRRREIAGLSQAVMGERAGLRQATVSKIESGADATRIGSIFALLAALDLELHVAPRTRERRTVARTED